jgi:hypothetical protein
VRVQHGHERDGDRRLVRPEADPVQARRKHVVAGEAHAAEGAGERGQDRGGRDAEAGAARVRSRAEGEVDGEGRRQAVRHLAADVEQHAVEAAEAGSRLQARREQQIEKRGGQHRQGGDLAPDLGGGGEGHQPAAQHGQRRQAPRPQWLDGHAHPISTFQRSPMRRQ